MKGQKKTSIALAAVLSFLALAVAGCGRPPAPPVHPNVSPPPIVVRVAKSDDDAVRSAAERAVRDCLSRSWTRRFRSSQGRPPVIKVRSIVNRGVSVVTAEQLRKALEVALVRSGARVPSVADERDPALAEVVDQRVHASDETMKDYLPAGSDFVLAGYLTSRDDGVYAHLQLFDVQTSEKVWIGIQRLGAAA